MGLVLLIYREKLEVFNFGGVLGSGKIKVKSAG